ncbi:ammonium transporter [Alcaligenes sp. SDU_A2]|uniref:ammonium transporter n=1 Tax=Alcaligenes sp. SDU_A2 TaxID=3136634 RepID=UPI00311F79F3
MNNADLSWMLVSTLLVLMMAAPGLALFYSGMVRRKNALSMLSQTLLVFSLGVVLWFIYGYSLAFTSGNAFIGGLDKLFLNGLFTPGDQKFTLSGSLPELLFAAFQATFAGLTCALVVGSLAERARLSSILVFTLIWFTLAYLPICHMVWFADPEHGGLLNERGALDFAGGTVVHINAGMAGLVGAWLIGPRLNYRREAMPPHNLPLTFIGAALLWVGWFGFNAGSALSANANAALAFFNTMLAAAIGVLAWTIGEWLTKGHPSLLGACSGAIAGLVGITPAAGFVAPSGALAIGLITSLACLWGVNGLKRLLRADDTLDVFGIHGLGGIVGALLTGLFNAPSWGGPGTAAGHSVWMQLWIQLEGVLLTLVWSGVAALIAFKLAQWICGGLRVSPEHEREGLDIRTHGESGYQN